MRSEKEKRAQAAPLRSELSCMEQSMGADGTEETMEALKESLKRKIYVFQSKQEKAEDV